MTLDPIMTRCLRFKNNCNVALQVYEDLYKDYRRGDGRRSEKVHLKQLHKDLIFISEI